MVVVVEEKVEVVIVGLNVVFMFVVVVSVILSDLYPHIILLFFVFNELVL